MNYIPVDYNEITELSKRDLAFINQDERLHEFVGRWASEAAFQQAIEQKKKHQIDRKLLVKVLQEQYSNTETSLLTNQNIESLLSEDTFTVITAHQPSLFTGPLYYIYKIASIIKLSLKLKKVYQKHNFVPVFISGGEDHDFEEINHLQVYNKQVNWEHTASGSVGRISIEGVEDASKQLFDILGQGEQATEISSIIKNAISKADSYADVNFHIINTLFKKFGLVYLNMDNADLKRAFIPIIKDELENQSTFTIVNKTIGELEEIGFKGQAKPREINLFYLDDGIRDRIILEDGKYKTVNTDLSWDIEEMMSMVNESPEKFSPNVLLRPLYQETILPNLAYVGGGGEIAYWTERAQQFKHYNIPFPLLIRRNSVLQVSKGNQKQIGKTQLSLTDFIQPEQNIIQYFLDSFVKEDIDLSAFKEKINTAFAEMAEKAKQIEEPLSKFVLAESSKQIKVINHIEAKLKKALKSKNEIQLNKLSSIRQKLFPNGGLQERHDNFTMYYASQGQAWIDSLVENLDPLDRRFLLAVEE